MVTRGLSKGCLRRLTCQVLKGRCGIDHAAIEEHPATGVVGIHAVSEREREGPSCKRYFVHPR